MLSSAFILFLLTATIGTRILLYQFTSGFHEYEAVFVYVSDFTLLLFLVVFGWSSLREKQRRNFQFSIFNFQSISNYPITQLLIVAFLLFSFTSIFFAYSYGLAMYKFARLLLLVLFAVAAGKLMQNKKIFHVTLGILAAIALLQSLIGIAQFSNQENLGLQVLGESPISLSDSTSSKVEIQGAKMLRAYGLFPHPNILGAFLVLGLLALLYFYLNLDKKLYTNSYDRRKTYIYNFIRFVKNRLFYSRLLVAAGIFIVSIGFAVSFSRGAWLSGALGIIFFLILWAVRTRNFKAVFRTMFLLVAIGYTLVAILGWAIIPRAQVSVEEPAIAQRVSYNELGIHLIEKKPFGVGIGNQVLHSVESDTYEEFGMTEVWQWQPIHNLYLLIASEIGVLGLFVFLVFIGSVLFRSTKHKAQSIKRFEFWNLESGFSAALLFSFLIFGLFDHFFWTIWQGQIMFWLSVGLLLSKGKK